MKIYAFNKDVKDDEKLNCPFLTSFSKSNTFGEDKFNYFFELVRDSEEPVLAIVHLDGTSMEKCKHEWKNKNIVLINCSSNGRIGHEHRSIKGLKILEMQPYDYEDFDRSKWEIIISSISTDLSIVDQIISGNVPDALEKFFGAPISVPILHAISILCQGYLVVHSDAEGKPEGDGLSGENVEIETALKNIFGPCVSHDFRKFLPEPFADSTNEGRDAREVFRHKVREQSFWQPLTEGLVDRNKSSPLADISLVKREWEKLDFKGTWGKVEKLIKLLNEKKSPNDQIDVVAGAFNQLYCNGAGGDV